MVSYPMFLLSLLRYHQLMAIVGYPLHLQRLLLEWSTSQFVLAKLQVPLPLLAQLLTPQTQSTAQTPMPLELARRCRITTCTPKEGKLNQRSCSTISAPAGAELPRWRRKEERDQGTGDHPDSLIPQRILRLQ